MLKLYTATFVLLIKQMQNLTVLWQITWFTCSPIQNWQSRNQWVTSWGLFPCELSVHTSLRVSILHAQVVPLCFHHACPTPLWQIPSSHPQYSGNSCPFNVLVASRSGVHQSCWKGCKTQGEPAWARAGTHCTCFLFRRFSYQRAA